MLRNLNPLQREKTSENEICFSLVRFYQEISDSKTHSFANLYVYRSREQEFIESETDVFFIEVVFQPPRTGNHLAETSVGSPEFISKVGPDI